MEGHYSMAGSSLLPLIDDIVTLLDDVALMSKTAATKTVGVLGDDLALSAEQVSGIKADRELPVVWAVAKGSMINKAVLVPGALLVSALAPWVITPMLMAGGAYLCFEGFEKIAHTLLHGKEEIAQAVEKLKKAVADPAVDMVAFERQKIKGAIRTDSILSLEIVVISLGTVAGASLLNQLLVLTLIAVGVTVGVYGIVAGIVRLDDLGFYLIKQKATWKQAFGRWVLGFAPKLMKTLAVVGTAAMLLVGGSILMHSIPVLGHALELPEAVGELPVIGGILSVSLPVVIEGLFGFIAGGVVLVTVSIFSKLKGLFSKQQPA
jgi:predicted DNA repair protein MutK